MSMRRWTSGFLAVGLLGCTDAALAPLAESAEVSRAELLPVGMGTRAPVGAFLNGALPSVAGGAAPALLSSTGAFSTLATITPSNVWVPLGLNSPGWSDGAKKSRWVAVPNDGAPYGPSEQVGFAASGSLSWPAGTVFMKHFEMVVNEQTGLRKRLETRFLVRDSAGTFYGLGYKWRADGSDADLNTARINEPLTITQNDGTTRTQTWTYPGTADCTRCHRPASGSVLGVSARQLNGDFFYPNTGLTDNQLHAWSHMEMFNPPIDETDIPTFPKLSAITDASATLEDRVRSYVDTNCSDCHQPSGPGPLMDARYETPIENQNLANGALKRRDLALSKMYQRDTSLTNPMPPVARNVVDDVAMQVVSAWVNYPFDVSAANTGSAATNVQVTFTSPLDPVTAAQAGNYAIAGLSVTGATAGPGSNTVTLTTSPMTAGASYTLTVNRVREAAAPMNPIWPATKFTFTYAGNAAPVTNADAFTTAEGTTLTVAAPGVLGNDSDPNGDPLTTQLGATTANGTLVLGANGAITYTPAAGFSGTDSFTYRAFDGAVAGALVTVSIAVSGVNDAPIAQSLSVAATEDVAASITLVATDVDSSVLAYTVLSQPTHGSLSGAAPNLIYTPAADYSGADSFTFKVSDGSLESVATISITVAGVADAPVAIAQNLSTEEDTARAVVLTATDLDSTALTFTLVTQPAHGTLTGTAPNLVYTPAADFSGTDSFTFKANDGALDSAVATITLTVGSMNDAPVASSQFVTTDEDTAKAIVLGATDVDTAALTFTVVTQPVNGTLTGSGANLTYVPNADFNGIDEFTFKASDGTSDSALATVTITINPINDAPVALSQSLRALSGMPKAVLLTATDADGNVLTYTVLTMPTHGTLTGTPPNLTYTSKAHFTGGDVFTFRVNDGRDNSNIGSVMVGVGLMNDAPVATAQTVTLEEDTAVELTLTGVDPNGDALTFAVATPPLHGTITGTAPNLRYVPNADFSGTDTLTFRADDGLADGLATVTFEVSGVNDRPIAIAKKVAVNGATAFALEGTDVDGDALTFQVTVQPAHGTITGTGAALTYTPADGFEGLDALTFVASDGFLDSQPAKVELEVKAGAVGVKPAPAPVDPAPIRGGCSAGGGAFGGLIPLAFLLQALRNRRRSR